MSFGFSVGDFLTVIKLVNRVRKDFAGAPDQFQHISNELRCLDHATRDIDVLLFGQDLSQAQEKRLCDIADNCRLILEDTLRTLNGYSTLTSRGDGISGKAKRVWKRLQWEPDDIHELRSRIALSVTYLNSFIEGFNLDNVVRLVKGQDRLVERQNQQGQQEILDWLTSINYSAQQSDFIRRRQAGTGQWLLDSPEYQHWVATKKGALFCPGIPGAGKTILTSIVVDNLSGLYRADNSVGICYIFLNFRRKDEQNLDDLMASLLKQLAHNRPALPSGSVKLLHDLHKTTRTRPSFDEICQALCSVISEYFRVFVVIDALDECQTADNCRSRFISELLNLWSGLEVNVFATSRGIPEIASRFIVGGAEVKEIHASDHDIARYVDGNLSHLPGFVSRDINLQTEIKQSIVQCVDGMFLLAQLYLDSLRGKPSRKAIRTALSKLAKGSAGAYDIAYDDAMARITGQLLDQKDLALRTLSWITSAKRPLTTEELRHALGVELNETEFDEDNLSDLQDIVSSCCGLVTIDEQNDIIRLVHYTTQEYFDRTRTLWFPFAESEIAKICVTYLSFDAFGSGMCKNDPEFEQRLLSYPLYDYASRYWGIHTYLVSDYQFCFAFLTMTSKVSASSQALLTVKRWPSDTSYSQRAPLQMSGLHLAAFFGLREAVRSLAETHDINALDSNGNTPLSYAAKNGHVIVVELLLEKGVEVDLAGAGVSPLFYAAKNGHEAVVRLLLENGVEINSKSTEKWKSDKTPLHCAAENGHEAVVRLLLKNSAEIDSKATGARGRGETPLHYAAENGHEAVVQLLLEDGAEINSEVTGNWGRGETPLHYAAKNGHEAVVRLLLESGAETDPKAMGELGRGETPLHYAAKNGHEGVVQLLLENGAEINSEEWKSDKTPLHCAAENGHEAVVRLLLKNSTEIDSKATGEWGKGETPLHYAAKNGHEAVVRLLLENGAEINSEVTGQWGEGETPLHYAAKNGHEAVVRLLLENGAEINSEVTGQWGEGETPLHYAAKNGHEAVVRLLLESGVKTDLKVRGELGRGETPLHYAVKNGREAIVRLLLEKGAEIDSKDRKGRTPLHYAAGNGLEAVVRLLLEKGAEIDSKDRKGRTPLHYAVENKSKEVMQLLLEKGANTDLKDENGRSLLFLAI